MNTFHAVAVTFPHGTHRAVCRAACSCGWTAAPGIFSAVSSQVEEHRSPREERRRSEWLSEWVASHV